MIGRVKKWYLDKTILLGHSVRLDIDPNTFVKGEEHASLPGSYVIFITENDVMGAGLPVPFT